MTNENNENAENRGDSSVDSRESSVDSQDSRIDSKADSPESTPKLSLNEFLARENLQKINGKYKPNNKQLKELVRYDEVHLGDIDTSDIKSMKELFANSTRTDFSGIESWDTSKVTTFANMFESVEHFNVDISGWNVESAKSFWFMFWNATNFNQPIGAKWHTKSAEGMIGMFCQAKNFNNGGQPFGDKWKMDNVRWASKMFWGAEKFNQPLNKWKVEKVEKMKKMFMGAKAFNKPLDEWNVANVVDMNQIFNNAESFNQDLSSWGDKLGKVKNLFRAFANTKSLTIDFLGAWKIPENCNTDNITKGSALESSTKSTKSKIAESKLSNFIISELDSSVICKAEWENAEFLGAWLPQNIKEQFKVYLAKYDDNENLTKATKDSWEFAFCEVFGYCFLIEKISENGGGINEEKITKNRDFNIYQGREIKDFDDFDEGKSECVYNKNDLEIYFAPQNIWIVNSTKFDNSESILSIVNAFVLLKAYKAKMRKLDEKAKNYKNAKDLQDSHENLCKFDLHSYQNTPIAQNELESTLLLEVWRKMSEFYMVANIHDELKDTISQISQLVNSQKQDKLNNIMRWVAILSAIAAILAAVPVVQNLLK